MTLRELIEKAVEAESTGVVVDWRTMCFNIFNAIENQPEPEATSEVSEDE